jgi:peptide/nickel transport system permease protein
VIFSVGLGWFPSIYDTTLVVNRLGQLRRAAAPDVPAGDGAGASDHFAAFSRFMRASMLDNLNQDYVRTARAKGLTEKTVVLVHVLRNSMIPVVTVIALASRRSSAARSSPSRSSR